LHYQRDNETTNQLFRQHPNCTQNTDECSSYHHFFKMLQHVDTFMIDNMCLLCSRSKYFFVNNIGETNSLNSMVHVDF
jgi:hypothetical protein